MISEIFSADFSLWTCAWQSTVFVAVGLLGSFLLRYRCSRAHQVLFLSMVTAVIVPLMSMLVKHYGLGLFVSEIPALELAGEQWVLEGDQQATDTVGAEESDLEVSGIERTSAPATFDLQRSTFPWRLAVLYGWLAASLMHMAT